MKKIIAALDGLDLWNSTIEYTTFLARSCQAHVVGVFVDDALHHSYSFGDLIAEDGSLSENKMKVLNEIDMETREQAVHKFEECCSREGLNFSIHRDRNVAMQELIHESIYADLMVINSREDFSRLEHTPPNEFLRELLSDVQCPVLVVPPNFRPIEKLVILYDGEPSSVHATKTFSYLMSGLKYLDTEVLSVKEEDESLHLPDNRLMREFMKRHFPDAKYKVLQGNAEDEIIDHLEKIEDNVLVILGAYRRNRVSRWFKPSMADKLLKKLNVPLFIAHN